MADSQVATELGDLRVVEGLVGRLNDVHAEGAGQVLAPRRREDPLAELVGVDVAAEGSLRFPTPALSVQVPRVYLSLKTSSPSG